MNAQTSSKNAAISSRVAVQSPMRTARASSLHLLLGPVGAGKSTCALGLAREHAAQSER